MKKSILILAAMALIPLAGSAQSLQKIEMSAMKTPQARVAVAQVSKEDQMKSDIQINANSRMPRRVVSDEVWYKRPEGSLLVTSTQNSTSKYSYVILPPFVDQKFVNMSTDKEGSLWYIGENEYSADENGDFTTTFDVPPSGYVNYLPMLMSGAGDEFTYGEEVSPGNSFCLPVDTIYSLTQLNRNGGYWSGFSNGYVFGTHESTYTPEGSDTELPAYCEYITEYFEKPASTMYLADVWFQYNSNSQRAIPEGTDMTLKILKVLEDGTLDLDEPIATMTFNMNDTVWTNHDSDGSWGLFLVRNLVIDAFGTEQEIPVLIDDEFAIRIEGFHQEGVDFGLYMAEVYYSDGAHASEDAYQFGGNVYPTVYSYVNDEGEVVGHSWQFRVDQRQFNAVMFLDAMYDVALVEEDYTKFIAPVEGGIIVTEAEFEYKDGTTGPDNTINVYTTLPWESTWTGFEGEENYFIVPDNEDEDFPDWLEWTGFSNDYYDDYRVNLIQLTAAALPEGTEGRSAVIRIVSDRGAMTDKITIVQGTVTPEELAVSTVKADNSLYNGSAYSLTGQKISKNFKGMFIKNGKKFVK